MKNSAIKAILFSLGLFLRVIAGEAGDPYRQVMDYLSLGRPDSALALSGRMAAEQPSNPYCAYLHSLALYESYSFERALAEADRSVADLPAVPGDIRARLLAGQEYLRGAWKVLSAFKEIEGTHFIFCYADPRDRIMADEVLAVLDSARAALGRDFGFTPSARIRVEVYPDRESFIAVSTLSEDEVSRTGTVALSKFNRLLFISPRLIARGYRWKETVCHEYAHYVVSNVSRNRAPIWFHEGIAHYEEVRFDGRRGNTLSSLEQDLLYRALRDNTLVSFARMHPSMAKLKDATESGTAFAEVLTAVHYIVEKSGVEGLRSVLSGCGKGLDLDSLLKAAVAAPEGFEPAFFSYLRKKGVKPVEGVSIQDREFADSSGAGGDEEYRFRKYIAISEMLLERKRVEAAVKELERADKSGKNRSPWVLNQTGRLYEKNGEPDRGLECYNRSIDLFPEYCTGYFNRARSRAGRGDSRGAALDYLQVISVNPFHGPARAALADLYKSLGDREGEKRQRDIIGYLSGLERKTE